MKLELKTSIVIMKNKNGRNNKGEEIENQLKALNLLTRLASGALI